MSSSIPVRKDAVVRRVFEASPHEIFESWTTKEIVEQWWGPPGFITTVTELDLCEGGRFRFAMLSPTGSKGATAGIYRVIDSPHNLEFVMTEHCNCDLEAGLEPQLEPCLVTVVFKAIDGDSTELTIHHRSLNDSDTVERVSAGWSGSLTRLNELMS